MEGVMMRGQRSMALAVRDGDGEIQLETTRLKARKWYNRAPVIRGVVAFVNSLFTGITTLTRSAEVAGEDDEKLSKGAMGFAVVLGVVFAVALFIALPEGVAWIFDRYVYSNVLVKSLISGVLKIVIFIVYLLLISKMKDIRRTFMYHGAEHRTINCFEAGLEMKVENVQKCSTRHNRCGTTFLFLVLVVSIIIYTIVNFILKSYLHIGSAAGEMFTYFAIKLALLPLIAGLSYEVLRLFAALPDNKFTRILRAPGLALQRLTTYPPEDDMAEVAIAAFTAVAAMDADDSLAEVKFGEIPMEKVTELLRPLPNNEAAWLLSEATAVAPSDLYRLKKIVISDYKKLKKLAERRLKGEPFDYVVGNAVFYGQKIKVTPDVLIPRNETELLAEKALELCGDMPLKVLDMCTGSGCVALAIAANSNAAVTAADISEKALAVAAENLGGKAELVLSDLFSGIEGEFDVIVANPPYVAHEIMADLPADVKCQPALALDGGEEGLEVIRRLVAAAPAHLSRGGKLLLEIGYDQGVALKNMLTMNGFSDVSILKDYSGNDRIAMGTKL